MRGNTDAVKNQREFQTNKNLELKWVLVIAIPFGLFFNFINLYLSISMGFISIGLGSIFALLLGKLILRKRGIDKRSNLSLITIAFGASLSAEASRTLLLLIWLALNAETITELGFDRPAWLLPGDDIINNQIIFHEAWILPILIHWFLMLVPGLMGIMLGLMLKNKFITDDKEYPFPGVIQQAEMINVLSEEKDKLPLFLKSAVIGFVISAVTSFLGFSYLDFSQPENGWILGVSLGIIGVSLFAVGFIIDRPKMTFMAAIASIFLYGPILGPFLLEKLPYDTDFYSFFTTALGDVYLSVTIGFLLGALLFSGLFYSIIKSVYYKSTKKTQTAEQQGKENKNEEVEEGQSEAPKKKEEEKINTGERKRLKLDSFSLKGLNFLLLYGILFLLCVIFVYQLRLFGNNLLVTILVVFWIMGIGSAVTFYLSISSSAKSSTSFSPPFIFDLLPVYLVGIRNSFTPYLASPAPEIREGRVLVSSYKLAQVTNTNTKAVLKTF